MITTTVTILIIIIAVLFICFISPILTFIGFVFKPLIWICCRIFKLIKKAFKELSVSKKEQQNKKD